MPSVFDIDVLSIDVVIYTETEGAAVSAHTAPHNPNSNDFGHLKAIDAMNKAALNTVTVTMTQKDLLIFALSIANVLTLTVLVYKCTKKWKQKKMQYEAVSVLSENECLQN